MLSAALTLLLQAQTAPVPPEEAPRRMTLPEGFRATLFAGEPDVVQPMAFTIDDRGRLWVVESYGYPTWSKPGEPGKDRILILEDADGDGRFDSRKVFAEKLANVSGLALGFGGAWLCATPYFLFLPDRDGDDRPDGPAEILLDGWDLKAKHNVFTKPVWGPDGWLYGCNGILSNSKVGKPGAPDAERASFNCGVWRFHPIRRVFETVAHGTTNPWGIDWDDRGQMFITNCVIKHVWHVVPGAHFERMHGQDVTAPNLFGLMPSIADHLHWAGGKWQDARGQPKHSEFGGGHAHVGAMVYLGDNWPDRYRTRVLTVNLHGNRVQSDLLERKGSTYVARHDKDFLLANDSWFRGLDLQYGPDGGVFITDWSDTGECHDYDKADAANGRIHKITYGDVKPVRVDLGRLSDAELVKLQLHKNDWFVRHARRRLQERAAAGALAAETAEALLRIAREEREVSRRLRGLWAYHAAAGLDEKLALEFLRDPEEDVRHWAVLLAVDAGAAPSAELLDRLAETARKDPSPAVRLALAAALQKLHRVRGEERAVAGAWAIAEGLAGRAEDAEDAYLPLMIWYGLEPLLSADRARAAATLPKVKIPLLRQFIARLLASK
jgi:putative membrane-bound dehydrogenase-like protein